MDERLARTIRGIKTIADLKQLESNVRERSALTVEAEEAIRAKSAELGRALIAERWGSMISGLIAPRRHDIGSFVAQVVANWDTDVVVDKLELQVGKDLQYIRINGTLVGGLIGLLLFIFARAFHFT